MSPEQIQGRSVDGRSDQFSLAALAFELVGGARPFQADSLPTMAHLIVYGERPSPRTINPSLPVEVDRVFQRAFARTAEDRFSTCHDFVNSLETAIRSKPPILAEEVETQEATMAARKGRWKLPSVVAALALALLLILGSAYWFRNEIRTRLIAAATLTAPAASKPNEQSQSILHASAAGPSGSPAAPPTVALPVIHRFSVDPPSIRTGDPATLRWEVSGADSIMIDHSVGKVSAANSSLIGPTTSTTYLLTAANSAGTTRRSAFVEVLPESIAPEVRVRQLMNEAHEKRRAGYQEAAFALFNQAAQLGNSSAMVEIGEGYRSGEGATEDDNNALLWFRRAADAGNAAGMVHLGVMYLLGVNGADPNETESTRWFQMAADREDAIGTYNLAMSYEKGRGVIKNKDKAKELYEKSAKLGNSEAQKRLNQLQQSPK